MKKGKKIIISLLCLLFISVFITQIVIPEPGIISSAEAAASVKLNKKKVKLTVGEKYQLKLEGTKEKVTWISSDKKIATVSKKGLVKAKKPGKVTITAQVGKNKYKCKVTVKGKADPTPEPTPEPTPVPTPEPTPVPTPVLSADRLSVQMYAGESTIVYITSSNGTSAAGMKAQTGDYSIASFSWGAWNGVVSPLTISANGIGNTNITITQDNTNLSVVINVEVLSPVSIQLPETPLQITEHYGFLKDIQISIEEIKVLETTYFSSTGKTTVIIGVSGKKISDTTTYKDKRPGVEWRLYDSNDNVVVSGKDYGPTVSIGESWAISGLKIYLFSLSPGSYRLGFSIYIT